MQSRNGAPASALSAAKQALLAKWLRGGAATVSFGPSISIPRRSGPGPVPLSFEQQRIWFFHQLEPQSPLYTMPIAAKLRGFLKPDALRKALNVVLGRHEALRTVFLGETPTQTVNPPSDVPMTFVDLRSVFGAERAEEARRILEAEAKKPFDLRRDLMIRTMLLQMNEQEWFFLVLMHHIASDDWSWRIFSNELAAAYRALASGESPNLPAPPLQYGDFALWQRQLDLDEHLKQHLDYWKRELADAPSILELPGDYPRPASQRFRGASVWLAFPTELAEALQTFSQHTGVTLFMTLLAAFETLVHRYTGQEDIVIGSPVAGRTRGGVENVIGLFVNMLAFRVNVGGNPRFSELLRRVQRKVLDGLSHQEMPFEKLVEELRPRRSSSHSPLIQVMFALQDELADNLKLPGLTVSPFPLETGTAKFDLTFTIIKSGTQLSCCAEYNSDLFKKATACQMLKHYENLLAGAVAEPEQRLSELPLLTSEERERLLVKWNATAAEFPKDCCIHHLFEARAKESPEAVAIVFEQQQLTYRGLDERASRLARHLHRNGVGPESLVAICMERSLNMVVALMAILKAGAAYVPLDPAYPAERLRFMLEDCDAAALLTSREQKKKIAELPESNAPVICFELDDLLSSAEIDDIIPNNITSENLAYVIYTSGSTGQPKGVQIPHRAVVNLLHAMSREPGLTRNDILLSVTSISFDIAALEIFLPLVNGARVVLANAETVSNGARLTNLIADSGATVMQATPSLWRFLVESGWAGNNRLKILCGGESLSRELADDLLARGGELWNLYGPTETTIWSSTCKVEPGPEPVSIGRPIANTQFYILDRALQPVPVGVPGELYIGGEGLARGYLNRPELSAERFVASPFLTAKQSRQLYRTGDVARYRSDGVVELLGRVDHQVKLRGHRIEPGEIESLLRQHPDVQEAVVVAQEIKSDEGGLVAYLISRSGSERNGDTLREFLKRKIPDYMIPSAFVMLDAFPVTPNGKMDRKALTQSKMARPTASPPVAPPRTPEEIKLSQIWREVLKVEAIGIHDHFFKIGGHSLLAMQVISRICKSFGADLSLRSIFETPTIAGLAETLTQRRKRAGSAPIQRRRTVSPERAKELLERLHTLQSTEVEALLEEVPADQSSRI